MTMQTTLNFQEQQEIFDRSNQIVDDFKKRRLTAADLNDLVAILNVSADQIEQYKTKAWFSKAWMILSGRKSRLSEVHANNLGKIQLAALRVIGDILRDSSSMKADLLKLFAHVRDIKAGSVEIKLLLLKIKESHAEELREIRDEISGIRRIQSLMMAGLTLCFLVGAFMLTDPSLVLHAALIWMTFGALVGTLWFVSIIRWSRSKSWFNLKNSVDDGTTKVSEENIRFVSGAKPDPREFRFVPNEPSLENFFVLGTEETRFLFSLQAFIVQKDIEATTNWSIRQKKDTWLSNWCTALTNGMAQPLVRNSEKLLGALVPGELDSMPQTRKRLVLFETCVFHPYFSLNGEKVEQLDSESEAWQQTLNVLIDRIGVSPALLSEAKNRYETALKELPPSNFWAILASTIGFIVICALTAGFAAPIIGAAVGGLMGLSGAVATSAGLAFLGGGALATGGFGVAGGTAALVGGGSVVGTAAGVALSSLFSSCDHLLVQQLAKLEASCCILFRDHPAHSELLRKVMIRLSEMESKFRSEEKEFKEQGKSKEARNAEKSAALIARTRNRLSP